MVDGGEEDRSDIRYTDLVLNRKNQKRVLILFANAHSHVQHFDQDKSRTQTQVIAFIKCTRDAHSLAVMQLTAVMSSQSNKRPLPSQVAHGGESSKRRRTGRGGRDGKIYSDCNFYSNVINS